MHQGFCKAFGFQPRNPSTHPSCAPPPPPPTPHRPESGRGGGPPPPPLPAPTPAGEPRARPSAPPGPGGHPPPLRRNGDAVRATAAGPAPANPHRRAGATRTTERDGGRAPHDPPVTTAHSEVTEGGSGQLGPPGGRSTGRPSPPPTPGRHFSPDRTRAPEGSAPATRRGPERSTAGRRPEREQGGRGATPPPPPPPTSPPAAGAPAPTPQGRGDGPPPLERGAGV